MAWSLSAVAGMTKVYLRPPNSPTSLQAGHHGGDRTPTPRMSRVGHVPAWERLVYRHRPGLRVAVALVFLGVVRGQKPDHPGRHPRLLPSDQVGIPRDRKSVV